MTSATASRALPPSEIDERIREQTDENIERYAGTGPLAIYRRMQELDREWDLERALQTHAAAVALTGLTLGVTVDRRWLAVPAAVAAFLLQHAVQGWCPPLPIFRRLGFRTASEIEQERLALKALRGDFAHLEPGKRLDRETIRGVAAVVRR